MESQSFLIAIAAAAIVAFAVSSLGKVGGWLLLALTLGLLTLATTGRIGTVVRS
jgi:hypothetical protein